MGSIESRIAEIESQNIFCLDPLSIVGMHSFAAEIRMGVVGDW